MKVNDIQMSDAGDYEVRVIFHDVNNNVILFDKVHMVVKGKSTSHDLQYYKFYFRYLENQFGIITFLQSVL